MPTLRRLAFAALALLCSASAHANVPALASALDGPGLVWTTGGASLWQSQAAVTDDGVDAARATNLASVDAESWVETTVTAPGVLSWRWRLDHGPDNASAYELLVGSDASPRLSLQDLATWTSASLALEGSGPVKLRWRLRRIFDVAEASTDAAYLDKVAYAPFGPPVLLAPAGLSSRGFTARWNSLPGATAYELQLATLADFSDARSGAPVPAPATSLVLEGLSPQTAYRYRLIAYGPEGISAVSAPASVTTPAIARPGNDAFAAATALANNSGSVSTTTLDATLEPEEPFAHQGSVWFRWTAPGSGRWRFQASAADAPALYAYFGTLLPDLALVAASSTGDEPGLAVLEFDADAGATYRLALDTAEFTQGPATLSWQLLAAHTPPANDAFAAATLLPGASGQIAGTNLYATTEPGEASSAARSVWYRWTAPATGLWTLDTEGSAIGTTLTVWSGNTLATLAPLGTDSATPPAASRLSLSVTKDAVYRISIDGLAGAQGALLLAWSLAIPTTSQTITAPPLDDVGIDAPPFFLEASASSGLPVTFTVLSGPATLEDGLLTLTGKPGTITLRATQPGDATYLPAPQVNFTLVVRAPPANDLLAKSILISGRSGLHEGSLAFATSEAADPYPANRSVWLRWTAPATGVWTLDTTGGALPTTLSVLSGPSLAELLPVASDTPSDAPAQLSLPVAAGTTYWLALDTLAETAGAVRLAWSFADPAVEQTIDFPALPDLGLHDGPVYLEATASSGLPVTLTLVSGPATLADGFLRLTGKPGTVTVRATQPGDAYVMAAAPVTRSFVVRPPPANDNIAAAIRLTGASGTATGGNIDASSELLDPFPANRSVWWRWTAPASGLWTINTSASAVPVALTVLQGVPPGPLEVLAADTRSGERGQVALPVAPGATYWIALDSVENEPGALSFTWTLAPPSLEQTITFDQELPDLMVGDTGPALAPTASSGLPVVLAVVSGPARLQGDLLVLTGQPGLVTLRATQPGDALHKAAAPVERSFTVAPLPAISITLGNLEQVYDGTPRVVTVSTEPSPRLGVPVVTYNGSTVPPINAGAYDVVVVADNSRQIGRLVVAKVPLTVTARDQRKLAGLPLPPLTLAYEGFVGDDTENSLPRAPVARSSARATSPGGTYPILVSGGVSPNYTFAYLPGILTVDTFAGRHEALLADASNGLAAGRLEFAVAASGRALTGRVDFADEPAAFPFRGTLALDPDSALATALVTVRRGTRVHEISLQLTLDGDVSGALFLDNAPRALVYAGRRLLVVPRGEKLAWTGAHTALLRPASDSALAAPAGSGHATGSIDARGRLRLAGRLADGARLTATLSADESGAYRLFARPYGRRTGSYLAGLLPLADHPDAARFPGRRHLPATPGATLVWTKAPGPRDAAYRAGFGPLDVPVILEPWLPPATRPAAITLLQRLGLADAAATPGADLALAFSPPDLALGDLGPSLPVSARLAANGALAVDSANPSRFTFRLVPATGAFSGSFVLADQLAPPPARPVSRTVRYSGVLLQGPATEEASLLGAGHLLLPSLPGSPTNEQTSGEIRLETP